MKIIVRVKGSAYSGNYGHAGIPGHQGGSASAFSAASQGAISHVKKLPGGVTKGYILSYTEDGRAAWKELRAAGDAHDGNSEVAAYKLNQLLGGNEVPETVFAEYRGRSGTSQTFVEGATLGVEATAKTIQDTDPLSIDRIVALDIIISNSDRHPGNFLIKDGNVIAIDNGHASWGRYREGSTILQRHALVQAIAEEDPTRNVDVMYESTDKWGNRRYNTRYYWFDDASIARWKKITREQFDKALEGISEYGNVRKENAWANLQYIVNSGGRVG